MGEGGCSYRVFLCPGNVCGEALGWCVAAEVGLGERERVLQLNEYLRRGNYQLCYNYFFSSCRLFDTFLSHSLYACGTTRTNRCGFPQALKEVGLN